jgi:hypothetical protein
MKLSQIHISAELRLLAILSRPVLNGLQVKEAGAIIPSIETSTLWKLLDHHRVWPCVHCNIRDHFPVSFDRELVSYLEQKYKQNIDQSKKQFKAYGEILYLFKQSGILVRTLKGIPLAKRLYGDQVKRSSRDIDLLIPKESFGLAHLKLREIGFKSKQYDELSPTLQQHVFSYLKDVSYVNQDGVLLELHVRLCGHKTALSEGLTQRLIYENNNDDADEFVYLSWHGAHSLFHRIKWVLDVALYIEHKVPKSETFIDDLLDSANRNDEKRSLVLAIILANLLYGTCLPDKVKRLYQSDGALSLLLRMAVKTIMSPKTHVSLKDQLEVLLCEILLPTLYSTKYRVLKRIWKPNLVDIMFFSYIPDKLYWAFVLLRPVRLVYMRTFGRSNYMSGQ